MGEPFESEDFSRVASQSFAIVDRYKFAPRTKNPLEIIDRSAHDHQTRRTLEVARKTIVVERNLYKVSFIGVQSWASVIVRECRVLHLRPVALIAFSLEDRMRCKIAEECRRLNIGLSRRYQR